MSELAWILIGQMVFVSLASVAVVATIWRSCAAALHSKEQDKKLLSKLLKDAQDRIHAATLSDYMALRGGGERPVFDSISRSDEELAEIESRSNGGM